MPSATAKRPRPASHRQLSSLWSRFLPTSLSDHAKALIVAPVPRSSIVRVLGALLRVVAAVEPEDLALAVDLGEDVDGPLPDLGDVGQRVARVVELEVDALVAVVQEQLGAVLEVPVDDIDEGLAVVGQAEQQLVLPLLGLPAAALPVAPPPP